MGKEERKEAVLSFMGEYPLALPPKAIYRNLRLHENITFSESSVDNYLDEFVEDGLAARVEPSALEGRKIVEVDEDSKKRAYYIITDKGHESLSE